MSDIRIDGVPIKNLKVFQLKIQLEERGLSKYGNKRELAERLTLFEQAQNKPKSLPSSEPVSAPNQWLEDNSNLDNDFVREYFKSQQALFQEHIKRSEIGECETPASGQASPSNRRTTRQSQSKKSLLYKGEQPSTDEPAKRSDLHDKPEKLSFVVANDELSGSDSRSVKLTIKTNYDSPTFPKPSNSERTRSNREEFSVVSEPSSFHRTRRKIPEEQPEVSHATILQRESKSPPLTKDTSFKSKESFISKVPCLKIKLPDPVPKPAKPELDFAKNSTISPKSCTSYISSSSLSPVLKILTKPVNLTPQSSEVSSSVQESFITDDNLEKDPLLPLDNEVIPRERTSETKSASIKIKIKEPKISLTKVTQLGDKAETVNRSHTNLEKQSNSNVQDTSLDKIVIKKDRESVALQSSNTSKTAPTVTKSKDSHPLPDKLKKNRGLLLKAIKNRNTSPQQLLLKNPNQISKVKKPESSIRRSIRNKEATRIKNSEELESKKADPPSAPTIISLPTEKSDKSDILDCFESLKQQIELPLHVERFPISEKEEVSSTTAELTNESTSPFRIDDKVTFGPKPCSTHTPILNAHIAIEGHFGDIPKSGDNLDSSESNYSSLKKIALLPANSKEVIPTTCSESSNLSQISPSDSNLSQSRLQVKKNSYYIKNLIGALDNGGQKSSVPSTDLTKLIKYEDGIHSKNSEAPTQPLSSKNTELSIKTDENKNYSDIDTIVSPEENKTLQTRKIVPPEESKNILQPPKVVPPEENKTILQTHKVLNSKTVSLEENTATLQNLKIVNSKSVTSPEVSTAILPTHQVAGSEGIHPPVENPSILQVVKVVRSETVVPTKEATDDISQTGKVVDSETIVFGEEDRAILQTSKIDSKTFIDRNPNPSKSINFTDILQQATLAADITSEAFDDNLHINEESDHLSSPVVSKVLKGPFPGQSRTSASEMQSLNTALKQKMCNVPLPSQIIGDDSHSSRLKSLTSKSKISMSVSHINQRMQAKDLVNKHIIEKPVKKPLEPLSGNAKASQASEFRKFFEGKVDNFTSKELTILKIPSKQESSKSKETIEKRVEDGNSNLEVASSILTRVDNTQVKPKQIDDKGSKSVEKVTVPLDEPRLVVCDPNNSEVFQDKSFTKGKHNSSIGQNLTADQSVVIKSPSKNQSIVTSDNSKNFNVAEAKSIETINIEGDSCKKSGDNEEFDKILSNLPSSPVKGDIQSQELPVKIIDKDIDKKHSLESNSSDKVFNSSNYIGVKSDEVFEKVDPSKKVPKLDDDILLHHDNSEDILRGEIQPSEAADPLMSPKQKLIENQGKLIQEIDEKKEDINVLHHHTEALSEILPVPKESKSSCEISSIIETSPHLPGYDTTSQKEGPVKSGQISSNEKDSQIEESNCMKQEVKPVSIDSCLTFKDGLKSDDLNHSKHFNREKVEEEQTLESDTMKEIKDSETVEKSSISEALKIEENEYRLNRNSGKRSEQNPKDEEGFSIPETPYEKAFENSLKEDCESKSLEDNDNRELINRGSTEGNLIDRQSCLVLEESADLNRKECQSEPVSQTALSNIFEQSETNNFEKGENSKLQLANQKEMPVMTLKAHLSENKLSEQDREDTTTTASKKEAEFHGTTQEVTKSKDPKLCDEIQDAKICQDSPVNLSNEEENTNQRVLKDVTESKDLQLCQLVEATNICEDKLENLNANMEGISQEIPQNINKKEIESVVTQDVEIDPKILPTLENVNTSNMVKSKRVEKEKPFDLVQNQESKDNPIDNYAKASQSNSEEDNLNDIHPIPLSGKGLDDHALSDNSKKMESVEVCQKGSTQITPECPSFCDSDLNLESSSKEKKEISQVSTHEDEDVEQFIEERENSLISINDSSTKSSDEETCRAQLKESQMLSHDDHNLEKDSNSNPIDKISVEKNKLLLKDASSLDLSCDLLNPEKVEASLTLESKGNDTTENIRCLPPQVSSKDLLKQDQNSTSCQADSLIDDAVALLSSNVVDNDKDQDSENKSTLSPDILKCFKPQFPKVKFSMIIERKNLKNSFPNSKHDDARHSSSLSNSPKVLKKDPIKIQTKIDFNPPLEKVNLPPIKSDSSVDDLDTDKSENNASEFPISCLSEDKQKVKDHSNDNSSGTQSLKKGLCTFCSTERINIQDIPLPPGNGGHVTGKNNPPKEQMLLGDVTSSNIDILMGRKQKNESKEVSSQNGKISSNQDDKEQNSKMSSNHATAFDTMKEKDKMKPPLPSPMKEQELDMIALPPEKPASDNPKPITIIIRDDAIPKPDPKVALKLQDKEEPKEQRPQRSSQRIRSKASENKKADETSEDKNLKEDSENHSPSKECAEEDRKEPPKEELKEEISSPPAKEKKTVLDLVPEKSDKSEAPKEAISVDSSKANSDEKMEVSPSKDKDASKDASKSTKKSSSKEKEHRSRHSRSRRRRHSSSSSPSRYRSRKSSKADSRSGSRSRSSSSSRERHRRRHSTRRRSSPRKSSTSSKSADHKGHSSDGKSIKSAKKSQSKENQSEEPKIPQEIAIKQGDEIEKDRKSIPKDEVEMETSSALPKDKLAKEKENVSEENQEQKTADKVKSEPISPSVKAEPITPSFKSARKVSLSRNKSREDEHTKPKKRKWGSSSEKSLDISSSSLKSLMPDVKPLSLSEVKMESDSEDQKSGENDGEEIGPSRGAKKVGAKEGRKVDHKAKDLVGASPEIENEDSDIDVHNDDDIYNDSIFNEDLETVKTKKKEVPEEKKMKERSSRLSTKRRHRGGDLSDREDSPKRRVSIDKPKSSRKIKVVEVGPTAAFKPVVPTARHPLSCVVSIHNLVRPFTIKQLKDLLQRTGKLVPNGFWIDTIKSQCLAMYENEDQAFETRVALHGVKWPTINPKNLFVDYSTHAELKKRLDESAIHNPIHMDEPRQERKKITGFVREWDLAKLGERSPGEREREKERQKQEREDELLREMARAQVPKEEKKKKKKTPQVKSLDELFKKTVAQPCIYWLPLTPTQIVEKEAQRRKKMAEHEHRVAEAKAEEERKRAEIEKERQKRREREKERQRERNSRRSRSRSRRRSRSGNRRSPRRSLQRSPRRSRRSPSPRRRSRSSHSRSRGRS